MFGESQVFQHQPGRLKPHPWFLELAHQPFSRLFDERSNVFHITSPAEENLTEDDVDEWQPLQTSGCILLPIRTQELQAHFLERTSVCYKIYNLKQWIVTFIFEDNVEIMQRKEWVSIIGHKTFRLFLHLWPQKLRSFFNNTWMERYGQPISQGMCTIVWSVAVSIFSVGGMVGSFSVGVMANRFGRYEVCPVLVAQRSSWTFLTSDWWIWGHWVIG